MTTAVRLLSVEERRNAVTPQQVAKQYETTVGNVYKLACLHKWRRIRKHGRIHYDVLEVGRTLGK